MSIFRKIVFSVFLAVSLGAAVWAYFNLKKSKAPEVNVIEHIPSSAIAVVETKNVHDLIQQLTRQSLIWKSLQTEELFSNAQKGIRYLDSLTRSSEEISDLLDNNSVYWSFIREGQKNENLLQFKLKEQKDLDQIEQFFQSVFKKSSSVSSFDAYDVNVNQKKWLACCNNGIVYFCSDLGVLQKSIQLNKKESLAENKIYERLLKLNGKQKNLVYFNHAYTAIFNKTLFSRQSLFNMEVQLNELTFTGYTTVDTNSFFKIISKQQDTEFHEFEKLPDHVASISGIAVNNAAVFYKDICQMLPPVMVQKNEDAWKALNDSALYNLRAETYENIDREIIIGNYWLENNPEQILSLKIKEEENAGQLLKWASDSVTITNDLKIYTIKKRYANLFSMYGATQEMAYGCIFSGNLVFLSGNTLLHYYAESIKNSTVLAKNTVFMKYAGDNLFQSCNYLYYENYDLIKVSTFPRLVNSAELNTGDDVLAHASLSAKAYKEDFQVRMHATHKQESPAEESNKDVLWSFAADSAISSNVYMFTNHLTHENELCFQDDNNIIYLVNATGTPVWKKEINEPIQSAIFTVDIFKNGKLQLLFNTENYLHLIDRNGNYVQGYPVKLPQKVTSPITLLDYDNTKDYRIFLACADKMIYNFSLYGIKTEGFTPVKTDDEVRLPVYYVKVGLSDYLITADVGGKIYAFSRKGIGRIDFKNKVIEGLANLYVSPGNNLDNTKLNYVDDKNNLLNKISFSDKKEAIKLGDELTGFRTTFDLLNDDKQMDMILYGDGAVQAYDLFGDKLLERYNEQSVYRDGLFAYSENNQQIIAFDQAGEKLDVIDLTGKLLYSISNVTRPPLVTELYKDGKKYVITVNRNRVNCVRLN